MQKPKKGKPEKFTPAEVIAALKDTNGMVFFASKKLGCCSNTIYAMMRRYPEVEAACQECRGHFIDMCESALRRNILNGKEASIIFALKTLGKDRGYVERVQQELGGVGEFDSKTPVPTRDELAARLQKHLVPTQSGKSSGGNSNGKQNGKHHHNGNGSVN